jgi:hypothetical protein
MANRDRVSVDQREAGLGILKPGFRRFDCVRDLGALIVPGDCCAVLDPP